MEHAAGHVRSFLQAIGSLPGSELHDRAGVTWAMSGIPWPMHNGVAGTDLAALAQAFAALRAHGEPFFYWEIGAAPPAVRELLTTEGLERFDDDAAWEEAEIAALPDPESPPGVTIEEAGDEASMRLWAHTLRTVYGFPEAGETSWLEPARRLHWTGLPWRLWLARADGRPAGVTMMFEGAGIAGLYGLGVAEHARRRGIGRALSLVALKAARSPRAGFWSTPEGSQLYRTLGFEPVTTLNRWIHLPRPLATEEQMRVARGRDGERA